MNDKSRYLTQESSDVLLSSQTGDWRFFFWCDIAYDQMCVFFCGPSSGHVGLDAHDFLKKIMCIWHRVKIFLHLAPGVPPVAISEQPSPPRGVQKSKLAIFSTKRKHSLSWDVRGVSEASVVTVFESWLTGKF